MEKTYLVVATPLYNSQAFGNYVRSLVKAVAVMERYRAATNKKFNYTVWHTEGNSYIDDARNEIAKQFLGSDATHLLFWDSDLRIEAESFARMLKAPGEVVGAAFRVKNSWNRWSVMLEQDENGMLICDPTTGLFRARRVATGFMKIARTAFETLIKAGNLDRYIDPVTQTPTYGFFNFYQKGLFLLREDYGFCERCYEAKIPIWCETRIDTGHWGFWEFSGNLNKRFSEMSIDEDISGFTTGLRKPRTEVKKDAGGVEEAAESNGDCQARAGQAVCSEQEPSKDVF